MAQPTRVCILTGGHLATCPRMLKAADALQAAGHEVRVVSARFMEWATAADVELRATRHWSWTVVDRSPKSGNATRLWSGLRQRMADRAQRGLGPAAPRGLVARAYARTHSELVDQALAEPADLFYGGTSGALAAAAEAGRRSGTPYALDLEDFHPAEHDASPEGRARDGLGDRVLRDVLPEAAFVTAGSAEIATAYAARYARVVEPILNTFPLPAHAPQLAPRLEGPLRLYWFSQTVGSGRGLEDVVRAVGVAGMAAELHLRGRAATGYAAELGALAVAVAPRLELHVHPPASPDEMVDACRPYDVGLAVEGDVPLNRALCLSNKGLTYVLAGLAVALTDTPGQRPFAQDLGAGALLFEPGDVPALAAGLLGWSRDPQALASARAASWAAAERRWHWEHPLDRGALLSLVAQAARS